MGPPRHRPETYNKYFQRKKRDKNPIHHALRPATLFRVTTFFLVSTLRRKKKGRKQQNKRSVKAGTRRWRRWQKKEKKRKENKERHEGNGPETLCIREWITISFHLMIYHHSGRLWFFFVLPCTDVGRIRNGLSATRIRNGTRWSAFI